MKKIRKAVFPVAGLGTRFLPATKASPKEMLPIVDKPLIQYAAEEAVAAGINQLIFVTSGSKRAIEDHFDKNQELEDELERRKKMDLLDMVKYIVPKGVSCIYIRQREALGLGHAVLCAKPIVGDEPFAVILADDLIDGKEQSCLSQMVKVYEQQECSVIAVEEVEQSDTDRYGIITPELLYEGVLKMKSIVEKPKPNRAPSTLAVVGRYLLTSSIFDHLERTEKGAGGEIQLTDAIAKLLLEEQVLACQFKGIRYDCGNKLGYLLATINYALQHPNLREAFKEHLVKVCNQHI
ncbi:UTP--glucose-1-phosphate uridylyltransferase GalU [Candidatus Parabeggiatoa sp. HSG14]|uniref:UTP--glucose-1-phosphate uridylyltransferase GalU n=1 Tax=Candidatus Parabeggiatoa sp. HSG14 TaxID=3055593 RepID=UPI0025A750DB|nr:UTP--glucose-1-phosphate uridylyltransferase GalU [Thiotrichales bacterium HSG14]